MANSLTSTWRNVWTDALWQSVRLLSKHRRFSILLITTLSVAIGANSAVFALIERQLLRPLPYPNSEELMWIYNAYPKLGVSDSANTVPDYLDRRNGVNALVDSALFFDYSYDLNVSTNPRRVPGVGTTASLFTTLGVNAALGRTFTQQDFELDQTQVVLLSHALWQSEFAGDPTALGREVRLSGKNYRVIGVMPEEFAFPRPETALWVPAVWTQRQRSDAMRGFEFAQSIGRLRPGMSLEQLNAQLHAVAQNSLQRFVDSGENSQFLQRATDGGFTTHAHALKDQLQAKNGAALLMLQAAVFLLLLIGCANVSTLLLIRFAARRDELNTRLALGAARADLFRSLFVECALLCMAGGVLGAVLSGLILTLLEPLGFAATAPASSTIGVVTFVLALAVPLFCMGLFALVVLYFLRNEARFNVSGTRAVLGQTGARVRAGAVSFQIALALGLVVGATLLLQSVEKMQNAELGFNPEQLISFNVNLSRDRFTTPDATREFNQRLLAQLRAIPGVQRVGAAAQLPFSDDYGSAPYFVDAASADDNGVVGALQIADSDYFQTMEIPLLRGRHFNARDDANSAAVVIIDKTLAERSFQSTDPIGQRIGTATVDNDINWRTVVGVVGAIRTRHGNSSELPSFFTPLTQQPARIFRVVLRSSRALSELSSEIRQAVARVDPEQAIWQLMPVRERVENALDGRRIPSNLWGIFALLALLLCALGSYSVLSDVVSRRRREIGLRIALGASRSSILAWSIQNAAWWILPGLLLGGVFAFALSQLLSHWLMDVEPLTPLVLLGPTTFISAVCLLACTIPARRAAQFNPTEALQSQ